MTEDLDALTGRLFATPEGREWLHRFGNHSSAHRSVCRDAEARLKRMRRIWGDGSSPSASSPDAPSP